MPASSNHFTIIFVAKILCMKTRYVTCGCLQLCSEIVYNILWVCVCVRVRVC